MAMTDLVIYYDGQCPACRREVGFYRRRDKAGRLAWRDVAGSEGELAALGISPEAALARIHAWRADGTILAGADVFVAIWRRVPGLGWLGALAAPRPVRAVLERGYRVFARNRYRLTGRCRDGTCPS